MALSKNFIKIFLGKSHSNKRFILSRIAEETIKSISETIGNKKLKSATKPFANLFISFRFVNYCFVGNQQKTVRTAMLHL